MKITDLKPGQKVKICRKDYTYEGIKKVPGKIGRVQKIVFQGEEKDDQVLYSLNEGTLTLENENILVGNLPSVSKIFYRVANNESKNGLWYDQSGNFTGYIHNQFNFCKNKDLQMPFNEKLVGWLSATDTLEDLFNWFTEDDILKLQEYGYRIYLYKASYSAIADSHYVIDQNSSELLGEMLLLPKN